NLFSSPFTSTHRAPISVLPFTVNLSSGVGVGVWPAADMANAKAVTPAARKLAGRPQRFFNRASFVFSEFIFYAPLSEERRMAVRSVNLRVANRAVLRTDAGLRMWPGRDVGV